MPAALGWCDRSIQDSLYNITAVQVPRHPILENNFPCMSDTMFNSFNSFRRFDSFDGYEGFDSFIFLSFLPQSEGQ